MNCGESTARRLSFAGRIDRKLMGNGQISGLSQVSQWFWKIAGTPARRKARMAWPVPPASGSAGSIQNSAATGGSR